MWCEMDCDIWMILNVRGTVVHSKETWYCPLISIFPDPMVLNLISIWDSEEISSLSQITSSSVSRFLKACTSLFSQKSSVSGKVWEPIMWNHLGFVCLGLKFFVKLGLGSQCRSVLLESMGAITWKHLTSGCKEQLFYFAGGHYWKPSPMDDNQKVLWLSIKKPVSDMAQGLGKWPYLAPTEPNVSLWPAGVWQGSVLQQPGIWEQRGTTLKAMGYSSWENIETMTKGTSFSDIF